MISFGVQRGFGGVCCLESCRLVLERDPGGEGEGSREFGRRVVWSLEEFRRQFRRQFRRHFLGKKGSCKKVVRSYKKGFVRVPVPRYKRCQSLE